MDTLSEDNEGPEILRALPLRIIVCGGRDYTDSHRVWRVIKRLHEHRPNLYVIHGAAKGADMLASHAARALGIPDIHVPAQWDAYGKGAGPIRNSWMLDLNPDLVIAFPGGRGTANMMKQARDRHVEVWDLSKKDPATSEGGLP